MACCIVGENETVMAYIEGQVVRHRKLRDLQVETGISKSSISLHVRRCLPKREALKHRTERKVNLTSARIITAWPAQAGPSRYTLQVEYDSRGRAVEHPRTDDGEPIEIPENQLRESDVVISISYEAVEPRNLQLQADPLDAASEPAAEVAEEVSPQTRLPDPPKTILVANENETPCAHISSAFPANSTTNGAALLSRANVSSVASANPRPAKSKNDSD